MDTYIPLIVILAIVSYAAYLAILVNDEEDKK